MHRFTDRVVVITGSGSGIGRAVAQRFAQEGALVALGGLTLSKLQQTVAEVPPERCLVQRCDVSRQDDVAALVDATVRRFGGIDVLVNNAGIAREGDALKVSLDDWHATLQTDLSGVFYGCRAALPHLLQRKGAIVNIASVSGLGADWGMVAYNAAKGGVVNLTRALALDFGGRGVRVNSVCPSLTRTGMTDDMFDKPELMAAFKDRMPLLGHAEPEDVAGVVAFLASDDARMVTGVNLPVDGGVTAANGQPKMG